MISGVLRNQKSEMDILEKELRFEAAYYTDERMEIAFLHTKKDLEKFLSEKKLVDIICVDVTVLEGISQAECLRSSYPKAVMIILADETMSPVDYMIPSILATALLLKPLSEDRVKKVMKSIFCKFFNQKVDEDVFLIETRDEKYRVPMNKIIYFEARNKKIFACTDSKEYCFYDTMDHLEEIFRGKFIRCHRSFLVNQKLIKKVMLSKNCIILSEGLEIPLSRSYKDAIKKMGE